MPKKTESIQRRSKWSWYFYDFGNSAYASIILLAVYSPFFKETVVGGAKGTQLWSIAVGVAAAIVAVLSPLLGTIADFTRFKKQFLVIFTSLSVVFTGLLFFVRVGNVFIGMFFFILAEVGYRAGQLFYDALLTDVSTSETIGTISGNGWAFGMIGGILALVIVIPVTLIGDHMTPFAFPIAALFFLFSAIPSFLWVKERKKAQGIPAGQNVLSMAFKNLAETFRSIKEYKEFSKYTISFLFYNNALMMLMGFAAIIGGTLFGLSQMELIIFVVILQVAGALGALVFGKVADRYSGKASALVSLLLLAFSLFGLFLTTSKPLFFVIGAFAGAFMSAAQTVSRSLVGQLAPPEHVTEFYGFLSVAGSASSVVGPLVFGAITSAMNNWHINKQVDGFLSKDSSLTRELALEMVDKLPAEKYSLLWGIASIVAFVVIGGFLFLLVKPIYANKKQETNVA